MKELLKVCQLSGNPASGGLPRHGLHFDGNVPTSKGECREQKSYSILSESPDLAS